MQVGTPLATLLAPGETAELAPVPKARKARQARKHPAAGAAPTIPRPASAGATKPELGHRRWVSPAARRIAASLGVDVDTVTRHRPAGCRHHQRRRARGGVSGETATTKSAAVDRASQMRKSIAAAMSRSKREIPHYYLADEILMETGAGLAGRAQRGAVGHRAGAAGGAATEGRRDRGAALRRVQRLLAGRRVRAGPGGSYRRRDLTARRRPRRTCHPRRRPTRISTN